MSKILLLPPNVAKIGNVAARNQHGRYGATTGIQVSKHDGKYKIEATNGRIAAIITGTPDNPEDYPSGPFLEAAPNGATSAVVPASVWSKGFRDLPKRNRAKPILGNLAVVLGKERITLSCTDLETDRAVQPRVVEGHFPDTDRVIPKGKPGAIIRVPIDQLRSLLDVAEEIGAEVTFEIHEGNGPMVLRGKHDESDQEFLGLIMPLIDASATQPRAKAFKGVAEVTSVESAPAPEAQTPSAPAEEKPKRRRASKAVAAAASILAGVCCLGRWLSV